MKKKKLLVVLLIICLGIACVGCGFNNAANYQPDPTSVTGHLVGALLNFFQGLTAGIGLPNYCVAIFLVTVLLKLITHPLIIKQQKNVKSMSVVQPKMQEINRKYENNPEKKQEAMMKLYKEESINPMASCLPLLIQMPIIMILFWGMRNFIPPADLAQYYSFFWIDDLSVIVSTTQYSLFLPIMCAVTTLLQQGLSMPNMQDKTQKIMLFMMPLMFLFMAQQFPAGLCLYWIFYGLTTAVQTLFVNYKLKIGLFATAEDKERTKIAREEQQKQKGANGKRTAAEIAKENAEKQKRKQTHTHTHNQDTEESHKKLPDKPWQ
ncbi:MAG: YidC/Oxa1 family membrane protein insertase [Clostridiales bacterium]